MTKTRSCLVLTAALFASPVNAQETRSFLQPFLTHTVYRAGPMTPIKIDYTGSCGGSYRCIDGTQLKCDPDAQPQEANVGKDTYKCFCEQANTCKK
jgi:hypothetical protein